MDCKQNHFHTIPPLSVSWLDIIAICQETQPPKAAVDTHAGRKKMNKTLNVSTYWE